MKNITYEKCIMKNVFLPNVLMNFVTASNLSVLLPAPKKVKNILTRDPYLEYIHFTLGAACEAWKLSNLY